jgi:hypothetical protein
VYHELTVWSRGIIMDKEARDVSACLAAAARALGYYADNVSDYVDDPDRTNCLVRRYARFGDSPIVDRFVYENPHRTGWCWSKRRSSRRSTSCAARPCEPA